MADVRTQQARERLPDVATCDRIVKSAEEVLANPDAYDPSEVMSARRQQVVWRTYRSYADRVAALETALRYELWVNHGCGFAALYGDDGEMSCGRCGWDFKRSDVLDTIEYVKGARLKRAAALAGAAAEPETHK